MGRILRNIGWLTGALIFFLIFLREGQSRSVDEILEKIESTGSSIRTFQADFVQKKEVGLFASAITSKGRLIVRPPDLLLWKVKEPLKAFFFIDRDRAGTKDPNTGEIKHFHIAGQDVHPHYGWLLRVFTGSFKELRRSFRIEVIDGDGEETLRLHLIPIEKRSRKGFDQILLGFDPTRFYLKEITIREASGDRTEISLENIKINRNIHKEIPSWLGEGRRR